MKNSRPMAALLLLSIFSIMSIFSWWVIGRADRQMRADLLQQTRLVAQALEVEHVLALSGTEADIESLHYRRLKEQLTAVRSANPQCRFVYLMGRKADGTVFFFVDSEPAGSKDYSPPGQIYDESTADFLRVFDTKVAAVEGPVTDRWGTWISTMVPIIGPQVGDVVAVLGMDINARLWKWDVAERAALPLGLMLVLLIGAVASFVSTRRIAASPKPVLRRLMPSLTVMVILLIIGMLALIYQQHRRQLDKEITVDISEISSDLGIALNQQAFGFGHGSTTDCC